jgi:hypothetical protein
MDTTETARRLIELCEAGQFITAQEELYDDEIVSIETDGSRMEGLANMLAKEQRFLDNIAKIHRIKFSGPIIAGNFFSTKLIMEIELNNIGRKKFEEICVYKVVNHKIVFEQFFRD